MIYIYIYTYIYIYIAGKIIYKWPCLTRRVFRVLPERIDPVAPRPTEREVDTYNVRSEATGQWEFQDPKMQVLYHIRPYFVGIFPYIGLT